MKPSLHYQAVSPLLLRILKVLMGSEQLKAFRLVGGTALALYYGHRKSQDLDLFSDAGYGSIDFGPIEEYLKAHFDYLDLSDSGLSGMGGSLFIGDSEESCIKLDIYHTDPYIRPAVEVDGIRLSDPDDIAAMKIDVVGRGGRKKDFWDIHLLLDHYTVDEMLALHKERYPWNHDRKKILRKMVDFTLADEDFTPICLLGKHWELIRLDIIEVSAH